MAKKDYDKTLFRLIDMLTKFSNGEAKSSKELATEYGVGVRTIQKDINERLSQFPIYKRSDHKYTFEYGYSLKETNLNDDEMIFLNLALSQFDDVDDIDKIKENIFKKLIHKKFYSPYYIKQDDIEDIDIESPFVSRLERYIEGKEIVTIEFTNESVELELYKIAAFDGFWYLLAKDREENKIKIYKLSDIKTITSLNKHHTTKEGYIENVLSRIHSAFFEDGNRFTIRVKVYKEIAIYFKNKEFLQSQKIEKELDDGSLILSFEVTHDEDIDNIIKSWLPHIEVLEPKRYREKLLDELETYVQKLKAN